MKTIFLSMVLVLAGMTAWGQTKGTATLYGFRQGVARGARADAGVREGDAASEPAGQGGGTNHFIFIASSARIIPMEVWIEGEPFSVSYKTVTTPVVHATDPNSIAPRKATLVPRTAQRVLQLVPVPPVESKLTAKGRSLAQTSGLVVVYRQAGKLYYATLGSLKELEGEAAQ